MFRIYVSQINIIIYVYFEIEIFERIKLKVFRMYISGYSCVFRNQMR